MTKKKDGRSALNPRYFGKRLRRIDNANFENALVTVRKWEGPIKPGPMSWAAHNTDGDLNKLCRDYARGSTPQAALNKLEKKTLAGFLRLGKKLGYDVEG